MAFDVENNSPAPSVTIVGAGLFFFQMGSVLQPYFGTHLIASKAIFVAPPGSRVLS